ncbi:hypothetical protein FHR71_005595 [Methylobacterium sp. RAS18]|nr:hypothetical protein [Methylobacterium sp. RAS18]
MGQAKRMLEEQEDNERGALSFLVGAGCIEECEHHDGIYFDGGEPVETAYKLANAQISSGALVLPEGTSRRDYTDLLKSVYEDNSGIESCYACDKHREDD